MTNNSPFLKTVHEFCDHITLGLFEGFSCLSPNNEHMVGLWITSISGNSGIVINSVWEWPIRILFPGTKETQFLCDLVSAIAATNDEWLPGIVCNASICMCSACLTWKLAKVITIETKIDVLDLDIQNLRLARVTRLQKTEYLQQVFHELL